MKALAAFFVVLVVACGVMAGPTVGIEGQVEVLLPGPELKAKPADRLAPVNLRIASTRPHGTQMQYDLRYIGFVPGRHDLRDWLLQQDGSPPGELPPIPVEVAGVLPAEHRGQIAALSPAPFRLFGGYQWLMIGAAALWLLLAIPLFRANRRRAAVDGAALLAPAPTVAELLRPLVERATLGQLDANDQARLERLLLGHWRQRLDLENLDAHEAVRRLREHPEAGQLLRALEDWLYRPPGAAKVDVERVLAPYAKIEAAAPPQPATERS